MDYLDPVKQARNRVTLFIGYILVAIGVVIAAIVLLNQAYGFGLGKNGKLIQNGLIFFSSQPNPANIYVDGKLKAPTNTQLYLPENIYNVSLSRSGYYDWQRRIELDGGSVLHFDYPFLFPKAVDTNKLATYSSAPTLLAQSPDQRWLLIGKPGDISEFDLYDLKNPTKAPITLTLPTNLLTKPTDPESWQFVSWADDNQHILLEHVYGNKNEYVLLDRNNPEQSVNLNTNLSVTPTKLDLKNTKYNQYFSYDATSQTVQQLSLQSTDKTTVLQHVLAYQSYGDNTFAYFTDKGAPKGQVLLRMQANGTTYTLHSFPLSSNYLIDLTEYNGTMYVAASSADSGKVYIYKDPVSQLSQDGVKVASPMQVLRVSQPNYLSFSTNAQFIVAENGGHFGIYDIENQQGYTYEAATPDAPQLHAEWMDGDRLDYSSGGKLVVFDYDHANQHSIAPASPNFLSAWAPDYKYVYTLAPNSSGQYELGQTWLLAPADR